MAVRYDIRFRATDTTGAHTHAPLMPATASAIAAFASQLAKVNDGSATHALAGGCVR